MNQKSAIHKINKKGVLLVFPIKNQKEPASLWSEFFPRSKMKWEWDDDGDGRVADLWRLMKNLSDCRNVVYSKWYQGRATFFSRELYTAMLCLFQNHQHSNLSRTARHILDTLESDSPLSTKELKKLCELQGRDNEPEYNRSLKTLFLRLLIVAYGEVDDGAFPSLAVGATRTLFEELWTEAQQLAPTVARDIINKYMPEGELFRKFFDKTLKDASSELIINLANNNRNLKTRSQSNVRRYES